MNRIFFVYHCRAYVPARVSRRALISGFTLPFALETVPVLSSSPHGFCRNGRPFIVEMLGRKQGIVTYPWKNPGETGSRDKLAVFRYYEPWDWLIVSGSYLDEFNSEGRQVRLGMALLSLLLIPIATLVIIVAIRRWLSRPLREAVELITRVANADFTVKVKSGSGDEVGQLMDALARMADQLRNTISEVRGASKMVHSDAEALRLQADEVARNSGKQSDATASMAAAMEQMSSSIDLIAANTDEARKMNRGGVSPWWRTRCENWPNTL